eukprot:TRINITY_DN75051_c0_g1_i1.p1 TRINITY_DN75051_c0_g1~~TRINITY_DN75051_c0_g1_i1.p1  ORF type:complete len:132 (-),score=19.64 TRINITY_DN75051_c0_g1_i1:72-467(-)
MKHESDDVTSLFLVFLQLKGEEFRHQEKLCFLAKVRRRVARIGLMAPSGSRSALCRSGVCAFGLHVYAADASLQGFRWNLEQDAWPPRTRLNNDAAGIWSEASLVSDSGALMEAMEAIATSEVLSGAGKNI